METLPQGGSVPIPPYLRFWEFEQALDSLDSLRESRVMASFWAQNGRLQKVRYRILGTLQFFHLIEADGRVRPSLRNAIEGSSRAQALEECLRASYPEPLIANLQRLTYEKIKQEFSVYSGSSATLDKAICFFLHAARRAGMKISSTVKLRETAGRRRSLKGPSQAAARSQLGLPTTIPLADPTLESGGKLILTLEGQTPAKLSDRERKIVNRVVDLITGLDAHRRPASRIEMHRKLETA